MHATTTTPSHQPRRKSILKKPSSLDLHIRASPPEPSSPTKKSAAFDDVARDLVTGDEVPQSVMDGSAYRAFHKRKGYRQEHGRALLIARVENMYEEFVRRVDERP